MSIKKTIFSCFSSNSNFAFSTCLILSAEDDPLVSVDLAFWEELNNFFCTFSPWVFFREAGIVPTPVLLVEMDCSPIIIEELSFFDNIFATGVVPE